MLDLAQLPANSGAPSSGSAAATHIPRFQHRFYAFLSYSHKDRELADWLHRELERFRVPHSLAGKLTAHGVVPKRLTPIFRDQHELAAAGDLGTEIRDALASSQYLIVLCSPDSAKSRWTNAEIEAFKRTQPDAHVLAAIASGEPFASDIEGREEEECFPPALRQKYDRRGRPTAKRAEPLAADLRGEGEGRRIGFLKLVAGMLGVGLDELVHRDTARRHRRMGYLAAACLAGMGVTSTLAISAIQARDAARDQRREAEGLIGFMLGDLKDKLEPIGKLDALDGVGSRVLAYYQKQDTADLTDAALSQRSKALSLMAEVATLRGDTDAALKLYREAMAGTQEAMRRQPNDPQRLFEHAQNVFYIGEIEMRRGQLAEAEAAFREYKRLADAMVGLQSDNLKWRTEVEYADVNLGSVLLRQRRFPEATRQFEGAVQAIQAVSAVDPNNSDYQKSVGEALAWLADAQQAEGRIADATATRKRQIGLLQRLAGEAHGDIANRQKLIPAHQALGRLLAAQGLNGEAAGHLRQATAIADELIPAEPDNSRTVEYGATAHLALAQHLLGTGQAASAAAEADKGCELVRRLLSRDATVVQWRSDQLTCLVVRTRISISSGAPAQAVPFARQAVALTATIKNGDASDDRYLMASARLLLGDAERAAGDIRSAGADWQTGLTLLPRIAGERPWETAVRADLLSRTGNAAAASRLNAALAAAGVRSKDLLRV